MVLEPKRKKENVVRIWLITIGVSKQQKKKKKVVQFFLSEQKREKMITIPLIFSSKVPNIV